MQEIFVCWYDSAEHHVLPLVDKNEKTVLASNSSQSRTGEDTHNIEVRS